MIEEPLAVTPEPTRPSCFLRALMIFMLPLLCLLVLTLGYIGLIPFFSVSLHTFVINAFIFVVFLLFVRHNASYIVCHITNSLPKMELNLQHALREHTLTIMGQSKSTLKIERFLEEYYREILNDNFAKVASSIFPMLGILGTFIAIALSMPDFTVNDLTALDKEISLLLSGVGTAFYASIYGIMLSLIWTYFEKLGRSQIEYELSQVERDYQPKVWQEAELVKHSHMQRALRDQEVVKTLKDTFNMEFIREMNEHYLQHFSSITKEVNQSFSLLTQQMQEASHTLRVTLETIQTRQESINAVSNIKHNIEGFNENAQNLQKAMERFDGTVDHTFNKIDSEVGHIVEKLGAFSLILAEQNQMILSNLNTLKQERRGENA